MKEKIISGIQQIGIGVANVKEAWKWYKDNFGMDIRIFEDAAMAELNAPLYRRETPHAACCPGPQPYGRRRF